ncbi:MAG TPA: Gfo/Idh/MocA family oxidoreductase [Saprospiraceae bacterium]|nr:Gfo/Idh/MocA family oxidoreductase [Saprospiraceae bacterium]
MKRRTFVRNTSLAGLGFSVAPGLSFGSRNNTEKLQIGLIGCGLRGQNHLELLLKRSDVVIVALADPNEEMIERSLKMFDSNAAVKPVIYNRGDYDYERMLESEDLDAVIIATPWEWHSKQAIAAMNANVFVGLEVSGAFSVEECWDLVNTHLETKTPLYFLENVCFRRDIMGMLNLVREGLLGEMVHLECGYQHDLRGVKFNDGVTPYNSGVELGDKGFSEAKWRTNHSIHRNGDLYPTHGIGPVSQFIDVNRGNRLLTISSMASKSRGLHDYIVNHEKGGENHPNAKIKFNLGDKVTSMITTSNGETIVMHHDTNLPRPYSLGFRVQGTRGLWMKVNNSIYIEGMSPPHKWENDSPYLEKYDHKIWQEGLEKSAGAGHGGMDYFLMESFLDCAINGSEIPFDIFDAATWMSLTPLSEASIKEGGAVQYIPDFTNGLWINRKNNFALNG